MKRAPLFAVAAWAVAAALLACASKGNSAPAVAAADGADAAQDTASAAPDASLQCPQVTAGETPARPLRVLFLTKMTAYVEGHVDAHRIGDVSVPNALRERGHVVVASSDPDADVTPENLRGFDVVFFFVTSGNVVTTDAARAALVDFAHAGKGFVGTHTATVTSYDTWSFGREMWGAQFLGHGSVKAQVTDAAVLTVGSSPLTSFLPRPWVRADEWYYFVENPAKNPLVEPLLALDEATVAPLWPEYPDAGFYGAEGHPLTWTMTFECARVFYTSFGHTASSWSEPLLLRLVVAATEWAGAPSAAHAP